MPQTKQIFVVAGVIGSPAGFLITQRLASDRFAPNLWEFPGGKIDFGECPEDAIIRELKEELDVSVMVSGLFRLDSHIYEGISDRIHVLLASYRCNILEGTPKKKEVQDFRWVPSAQLASYPFAPGDLRIVSELIGAESLRK